MGGGGGGEGGGGGAAKKKGAKPRRIQHLNQRFQEALFQSRLRPKEQPAPPRGSLSDRFAWSSHGLQASQLRSNTARIPRPMHFCTPLAHAHNSPGNLGVRFRCRTLLIFTHKCKE